MSRYGACMTQELDLLVLPTLEGELLELAWDAYRDAFEELRSAAIQRHVMTRAEFDEVMSDDRVDVYLVRRADGAIAAVATLTNELTAMPLVSPDFFAARWPDHFDAGRCWYIGFVGVRPSEQGSGAFHLIVSTVAGRFGEGGGVLVLDVPQRNMEGFHVPRAVKRIADDVISDLAYEMVDAQGYWAYTAPVPAVIDLRDTERDPVAVDLRRDPVRVPSGGSADRTSGPTAG